MTPRRPAPDPPEPTGADDDLLPGAPPGGPPVGAQAEPHQTPRDDATLPWDDTWALRGEASPADRDRRPRRWWRRHR